MDDAPITIAQGGAFILVRYPNRKSTHLYVAAEGYPIHCCNCGQDIGQTGSELIEHIHGHDTRRKHRRPVEILK